MNEGDRVRNTGSDYVFDGWIVAVFHKRNGEVRYVVENHDRILHIMHERQLRRVIEGES